MPRWVFSSRRSLAALTPLALPPSPPSPPPLSHPFFTLPPFLILFLLLFARRALNYGGNATKSSRLIELLLESRSARRSPYEKRRKKKEGKKRRGPSSPYSLPPSHHTPSPFILSFVRPSLAGMITRRREFPGNNFECVRLPARSRARGEPESVDRTCPNWGYPSAIVSPSSTRAFRSCARARALM